MTLLAEPTISPTHFAGLRQHFRGALLQPGEEGYDQARRVWNGDINRHPALIARCAGADDVVRAVRFARERDLLVSVKGGGHAVAGHAVCEGGVMIDLSLMKAVAVEPKTRTARAAGGLLWSDLDRATQGHALATTGGIISHTGIGGLTLGGGLGHLMRKHGLTVDNLLAVDLVTAEGEQIHVDADTEPELFWGLRGGGGNFGIATSLTYQLHAVGPMVLAGVLFWPLEQAPEILRFLRDFAPDAPDELGITMSMLNAPPTPFIPPDRVGKPAFGLVLVWAGDFEAGQEALRPLRAQGTPIADTVSRVPYLFVQSMLDGGAPHGRHYYWKAHKLEQMSDRAISVLTEAAGSGSWPFWQINGWAVGGAAARVEAGATAVGSRTAGFDISFAAAWPPPDPEGDAHKEWVRTAWRNMVSESAGVYANFISDEGAEGLDAAYGERLHRLTALKDRWDPTNFFRMNANIPPSVRPAGTEVQ